MLAASPGAATFDAEITAGPTENRRRWRRFDVRCRGQIGSKNRAARQSRKQSSTDKPNFVHVPSPRIPTPPPTGPKFTTIPGMGLWHTRNKSQNVGQPAFAQRPLSGARRPVDYHLKSMGWMGRAGPIPRATDLEKTYDRKTS